MRTPLVVVTGVDPAAMDAAVLSLSWDCDRAVVVRHTIDARSQVLTRVVSDVTGELERVAVPLEHACVDCALREDVLPTLHRLASAGRWSTIISALPVAAEADQLDALVSRDPRLARRLRLTSLVAAVGAAGVADLLGGEALAERGLQTSLDDDRGLGEVASAQVELADVVVLDTDPGLEALDLAGALARPDAQVVAGPDRLEGSVLARNRRDHARAVEWAHPTSGTRVPRLPHAGRAWRLDLRSPRPFHPERFVERIETLGVGQHRSRGCFWLPTRPGVVQQWAGAGAQLSIGTTGPWGRRTPLTRLVLTGLGEVPRHLGPAFEALLVTPEEGLLHDRGPEVVEDGLEPWLGDIRDAA